jgi:hypothetical protein
MSRDGFEPFPKASGPALKWTIRDILKHTEELL